MNNEVYLNHFIEAQNAQFDDALKEIRLGKKQTHWMWFIFSIAGSLGKSNMAQYYGINSADEARAFIIHPLLGSNFRECIEAMLNNTDKTATDILGKINAWKFQASVTLFMNVATDAELNVNLKNCLSNFYSGRPCKSTIALLPLAPD